MVLRVQSRICADVKAPEAGFVGALAELPPPQAASHRLLLRQIMKEIKGSDQSHTQSLAEKNTGEMALSSVLAG